MNWITGVVAVVALLIGILIGWGVSAVAGPSQSSLAQENADLKKQNKFLMQQAEEIKEKYLNSWNNRPGAMRN